MFEKLLSGLHAKTANDTLAMRRRFQRYEGKKCEIDINGKTYPVENWSEGGILFTNNDRIFVVGLEIQMSIKFKVRNTVLNLDHKGRVIWKGYNKTAVELASSTKQTHQSFQQIIDDHVASEFVHSQIDRGRYAS
tara:strand:+ start:9335 stop:9739 length:405 start_codon:yes stop_codon:yes gene_type:complete